MVARTNLLHAVRPEDAELAHDIPLDIRKISRETITCDRGTEFANWGKIERWLGCEVYFADPYCT